MYVVCLLCMCVCVCECPWANVCPLFRSARMCVPDNYARCVNDCSHGNSFLFWAKDVEGESRRVGREGERVKRGWTGELGGQNRNIFFMRQLLRRRGSSRIQSNIFWLKVPDLSQIKTGVVNQHQTQCCVCLCVADAYDVCVFVYVKV